MLIAARCGAAAATMAMPESYGTLSHLCALAAVGRVFDELRPGDRVGVLTFSHRLQVKVPMTDGVVAARAALARVTTEGHTALRDAVATSLALAEGQESRGLVLLFTDGEDNASWMSEKRLIEFARRADAILHVINVDNRFTPEPNLLIDRLTYVPKGPTRPGWHEVKVRLRDRDGTVKTRPGTSWRADTLRARVRQRDQLLHGIPGAKNPSALLLAASDQAGLLAPSSTRSPGTRLMCSTFDVTRVAPDASACCRQSHSAGGRFERRADVTSAMS